MVANGIIRLNILKGDLHSTYGPHEEKHYRVSISVQHEKAWESGLAEKRGNKCEWKDKHCDISTKHAGQMMRIWASQFFRWDGEDNWEYVGEVELDVGAWIVPCQKEVELFDKNDQGELKSAGHVFISSEFIPNTADE